MKLFVSRLVSSSSGWRDDDAHAAAGGAHAVYCFPIDASTIHLLCSHDIDGSHQPSQYVRLSVAFLLARPVNLVVAVQFVQPLTLNYI